jgi:glutaredoxin
MKNEVIVFTLNGCKHCSDLLSKLNEINIDVTEIEISQNKEIWDTVVSQTGHNILPSIFIKTNEDDTGPIYIPGRDFQNQEEIVEIIQLFTKT